MIEIVKAFARILFRTSRLASAKQCCIFWIFRDSPIAARSESQEELPTVTSYTSFHCCGGGVLPAMPEGMRPVVANDWAAIWHRCWLCRRNLLSLSSAWDRTVNFQYADVVPKRLKPLHCGDSRATAQSAQPMPHRPLMILSVSHDSPSSAVHMSFILTHLHRLQLRRRHTALCPASDGPPIASWTPGRVISGFGFLFFRSFIWAKIGYGSRVYMHGKFSKTINLCFEKVFIFQGVLLLLK